MSATIFDNRHRRDVLLATTDLYLERLPAAPLTIVLTSSASRSRFFGHALTDPDVEWTVVVEDHADGGDAGGGIWDCVGEREDGEES